MRAASSPLRKPRRSHVGMDGARIGSIDISINKVFTARAFDSETAQLAAMEIKTRWPPLPARRRSSEHLLQWISGRGLTNRILPALTRIYSSLSPGQPSYWMECGPRHGRLASHEL